MSLFKSLKIDELLSKEVDSFEIPDDENGGDFGSFVPSYARIGKVIRTFFCYSIFCPQKFKLSKLPQGSVCEEFTNTNRYFIPKDDVARNQFKALSGFKENYRYTPGFLVVVSTSSLLGLTTEQMNKQKEHGDYIYKFLPYSTTRGKNWYWPLLGLPAFYSAIKEKEYNLWPFNKAPLTNEVEEDKKKYHYDITTLPLNIIPGGKDSNLEIPLENYKESEMWQRASAALEGGDPYMPDGSIPIKTVLMTLQHNKLKGCYVQFGDVYDHTPYGAYTSKSTGKSERSQYPVITKIWATEKEAQKYLDEVKKAKDETGNFDFKDDGNFDPNNFTGNDLLIELKNNFASVDEVIEDNESESILDSNLSSVVHPQMSTLHLRAIWDRIG